MKNLKIIITILLVISSISISASSKIKRQCKIVNGKITRCDSKGSNSSSLKKRIKDTKLSRNYIGIDKARAIALSRVKGANNSHVKKIKLDYDDGRPVYEGEIRYKGWEYEFEIDAITGRVLDWEKDRD